MNTGWLQQDIALTHCRQSEALVARVRQSFYQQYHSYCAHADIAPTKARQLAHSLKSTAPAIGAAPLSVLATRLAPPAPEPTHASCRELLDVLTETLQAIKATLPDADQISVTKDLRSQLQQHNIGAVKLFSHWTEREATHWPADYLHEIKTALAAFDFPRATALLDDGLNRFVGTKPGNKRGEITDV